jgi:hypothetical protein
MTAVCVNVDHYINNALSEGWQLGQFPSPPHKHTQRLRVAMPSFTESTVLDAKVCNAQNFTVFSAMLVLVSLTPANSCYMTVLFHSSI